MGNFVTPLSASNDPEPVSDENFHLDIELPTIVIHSNDYLDDVNGPFSVQQQFNDVPSSFQSNNGDFQVTDNRDEELTQLDLNIAGPTTKELQDIENNPFVSLSDDSPDQEDDFYDQMPDKEATFSSQKGVFAPKQTVFLSQPQSISSEQNPFLTNDLASTEISSIQDSLPAPIFVTPAPRKFNLPQHDEIKRSSSTSSPTKAPELAFSTLLPLSSLQPGPPTPKEEGFLGLVYASTTTKKPRTSYKNNAPAPAPAPSSVQKDKNTDHSTETFEETFEDAFEEGTNDDDALFDSILQPGSISPRGSLPLSNKENSKKYSPPPEAAFASTYKAPLTDDYDDDHGDGLTFSNLLETQTSSDNSLFQSTLESATLSSTSSPEVTNAPNVGSQSTFENTFLIKSTEKPQSFAFAEDGQSTSTNGGNTENLVSPAHSFGSPIAPQLTSPDDNKYFQLQTDIASLETTETTNKPILKQQIASGARPGKNENKAGANIKKYTGENVEVNAKPLVNATTPKTKHQSTTRGNMEKLTVSQPAAKITKPAKSSESVGHELSTTPKTSLNSRRPEALQQTEEATGLYDWPITSDPTIIDFTQDHKHPTIR